MNHCGNQIPMGKSWMNICSPRFTAHTLERDSLFLKSSSDNTAELRKLHFAPLLFLDLNYGWQRHTLSPPFIVYEGWATHYDKCVRLTLFKVPLKIIITKWMFKMSRKAVDLKKKLNHISRNANHISTMGEITWPTKFWSIVLIMWSPLHYMQIKKSSVDLLII